MKPRNINKYIIACICFISGLFLFGSNSVRAYDEVFAQEVLSMIRENKIEEIDNNNPYQTKTIIVKAKSSINTLNAIEVIRSSEYYILQFKTEQDTKNALNYYKNSLSVEYAEPDIAFSLDAFYSNDEGENNGSEDASSEYQSWGASYMGVDKYNEYLKNDIGVENLNDVVVAVLDTGIDTDHEWFINRIAPGGRNFSGSVVEGEYEYEDEYGHGTHVSGIIVDMTLPNVKILPIRLADENGGLRFSSIVLAVEYIISLKEQGMNIYAFNMSFGLPGVDGNTKYGIIDSLLTQAYSKGMLPVAAAGNDGDDSEMYYPANTSAAFTVSAAGVSDSLIYVTNWSSYGSVVDIAAPGEAILSAAMGGGTVAMSGTSMAAPHVVGAVALLYSSNGDYTLKQVETMLTNSAMDLGNPGWDTKFGHGFINLNNINIANPKSIDIVFSETEMMHDSEFDLTLTSNNPDAKIYYTLDGSYPSLDSENLYTSAIHVSKTMQVYAIAYVVDENDKIIASSKMIRYIYCLFGEDIDGAFTIDDNGSIISYNGLLAKVEVPYIIDGIVIKRIHERAFYMKKVVEVVLPETIYEIGSYAFAGTWTLEKIYAPGVKTLHEFAFAGCYNLLTVDDENFPKLNIIHHDAFTSCESLEYVYLSDVTYVGDGAFSYCSNLISVTLLSATEIGEYAFECCYLLKTVEIPKVVTISGYAFIYCYELEEVVSPSLTYIGAQAFGYNSKLNNIDTSNVITISVYAFDSCSSLRKLYLPNIEYIGWYVFAQTNVEELYIGEKLRYYESDLLENVKTVYGYPGSKIEELCKEADVTFIPINKLTILENIPTYKDIFDNGVNYKLEIKAAGEELKYTWYEASLNGSVELDNDTNILPLDSSMDGKAYYVVVTDEMGNTVKSNICWVSLHTEDLYRLKVLTKGKGTVSNHNVLLAMGESVTVTFTPDEGYVVSSITANGIELTGSELSIAIRNGYTFRGFNTNKILVVTFVKEAYEIKTNSSVNGTQVEDSKTVGYGQNTTIDITPDEGYEVSLLMVNGKAVLDTEVDKVINEGYLFANVDQDYVIDVIYRKKDADKKYIPFGLTYVDKEDEIDKEEPEVDNKEPTKQDDDQDEQKEKPQTLKIIAIVSAVIVLCGLVVGVIILSNKKKQNNNKTYEI